MSKKFYFYYQLCLMVVTVLAIVFAVLNIFIYGSANTMVLGGAKSLWSTPLMYTSFSLLIVAMIGYVVLLFLTHFKGEKLD